MGAVNVLGVPSTFNQQLQDVSKDIDDISQNLTCLGEPGGDATSLLGDPNMRRVGDLLRSGDLASCLLFIAIWPLYAP